MQTQENITTIGKALEHLIDVHGIPHQVIVDFINDLNKNSVNKKYTAIDVLELVQKLNSEGKDAKEEFEKSAKDLRAFMLESTKQDLEHESAAYSLENFMAEIADNAKRQAISTGFKVFDEVLGGGLYAGLYVVGAISSLGKTTFCLQMGDYIARQGKDVMVVSLEMARNELIAKSVSRITFSEAYKKDRNQNNEARTTREILNGNYSDSQQEAIENAIKIYGDTIAPHLYIHEGIGNIGVEEIKKLANRFIETGKEAPVIIIDYLQILAPASDKATDKQNADKAVLELKRLSRDLKTPVICISSFNRDNYTEPLNMTAFKESGAIEYSSDVLIGLQYNGMDYLRKGTEVDGVVLEKNETQNEHTARVRQLIEGQAELAKDGKAQKIQVKVLKNRNESKGNIVMGFVPKYNYFNSYEVKK